MPVRPGMPVRANDPDVAAIMHDQYLTEQPTDVVALPVKRASSAKHYFRTDPGNRIRRIRIPGVLGYYAQDVGREDGTEPIKGRFQRLYEKRYPDPAVRELHEAVREANGGEWYITFQAVPNHFEGYLETDSDILADYVRSLMAAGELPFVYEDVRTVKAGTPTLPAHRAVAALRLQKAEAAEGQSP